MSPFHILSYIILWSLRSVLLIPGAVLVINTGVLTVLILAVHWFLKAACKVAAIEDRFSQAIVGIKMAAAIGIMLMSVAYELLSFYHHLFGGFIS